MSPWEAFDSFDKNGSGLIDEMEFFEVLRALKLDVPAEEATAIFKKNDEDNRYIQILI